MKKGMVAATMTVATSLGLGCPLVAVSQTSDNVQQSEAAPAAAQPPSEPAPASDAASESPSSQPDSGSAAGAAPDQTPAADAQQQPSEAAAPAAPDNSPQNAEAPATAQQPAEAPPAAEAPQEVPSNDQPQNAEAPGTASEQAPATAGQPSEAAPPAAAAPGAPGSEQQPNNAGEVPPPSPEAAAPPAAGAAPAETAETGGLETVVVTARRSAENIQKVPVAITAFTDKDLERQQINGGQDLAGKVPSLVIGTSGQTRNVETPTIRGQGAVFGASPGVVMYYGEVPLPADQFNNGQGGPGKFFDLSNLQVLKGSQGTLFGRNTTGGALLLEPHKPDQFFSASAKAETGNYEAKGFEGILNMPIGDTLAVRVGAKFYERAGFTHDVVTGEDYDSKGYRTFRLGLMWKPTDGISNYLLGYYTHSADNGTSQVIEQINNTPYTLAIPNGNGGYALVKGMSGQGIKIGCIAVALAGDRSGTCGQDVIAAQQARGIRAVALDNPSNDLLDTQALIDNFSYELNDQLTLRNIASYSLYKHSFRWDADGSDLTLNDIGYPYNINSSNTTTYTEELQLQGNLLDHDLKLVEGLYYEYLHPDELEGNVTRNIGVTANSEQFEISHRTYGPYAQGTFNFGHLSETLESLNFTAGVRYSISEDFGAAGVTPEFNATGNPIPTQGAPYQYHRVKSEAPTYTVGLDYKLATTLVYGKVSHGYKSGGISAASVNPAYFTYKPEFVMNYEIGSKSDFMIGDMPVRVNTALYYTDYTDMQRVAGVSYQAAYGSAVYNAGKAAIMGFETDATAQPLPGLTVALNYSYTYGKYEEYSIQYGNALFLQTKDCDNNTISQGQQMNLACVPFAYAPKHQGSATVRYQFPIPESVGAVDLSTTFSFIDSQYADGVDLPSQSPGSWLGAYGLLNASLGWTKIYGSNFDLQLFGSNLTDRNYRISNSNVWTLFFYQSSIYGEPRTFGGSVAYHWGD
jgi:iron complex outermembrane receptor protein